MVLKLSPQRPTPPVMRLLGLLLASALAAGCLGTTPPVRLATASTIAVHIILEDAGGRRATVSSAVAEAIDAALSARNLVPTHVPTEAFTPSLTEMRASPARFAALVAAAPEAAFHLLIQANARYSTQMAGRFRWDVDIRTQVAAAGGVPVPSDLSVGAHLLFEHERESDAFLYVKRQVADEVALLVDRALGANPAPKAALGTTPAVSPIRDALYFVMIDRFENGDPTPHPDENPADPAAWFGGDFRGLEARLDWLTDLGVGAVWLSPPFATRQSRFFGHGAFHGYWTEDLGRIEARFGNEADLQRLARSLQVKGLGLWLDLVVNHVGPEAPLVAARPHWFRPPLTIVDWNSSDQLERGQVHGLPDLDQEQPEVFAWLTTTTAHWLETLVPTGLRLDAVKHVSPSFWLRFNSQLLGRNPAPELLAEILDGDPVRVEAIARAGRFTAIFDFALHHALLDTFCRNDHAGPLGSAISVALELDDAAAARDETPLVRYAFLDNHDLPRVASICANDARTALAFDALVALPARPAITWGTEVGLTGATEPANRAAMAFDATHPLRARMRTALDRRAHAATLRDGHTRIEAFDPAGLLAFSRSTATDATLVAINPTASARNLALPAHLGPTPLSLPALSVTLHPLASPTTAASATALVPVTIRVSAAPQAPLRVVGASPSLGGWDPAHAPSTDDAIFRLSLAPGRLYALKLVATAPGRPTAWEDRPNRYLFVAGPTDFDLVWGA